MSKTSLPDVLGVQRLRQGTAAPVTRRRRVNALGEVSFSDVAARRRTDAVIGDPNIITPPALTDSVEDYAPEGFGTASIVMISASVPGVEIDGLQVTGIRTLRRTWCNVGAHTIRFKSSLAPGTTAVPEDADLRPGRSMLTIFDPVESRWVLPTGEDTETEIDLAAELGADLLYWWEVPDAASPLITLNGGNVSQLNDRVGSAHAAQPTASNQPAYNASGGPNNQPFISFQGGARFLLASISIAAANRVGFYSVQQLPATGTAVPASVREGAGTVRHISQGLPGSSYTMATGFTSGLQTLTVTVPARSTNWYVAAMRPLASGAVAEINGATTTPNFTGNDTVGAVDRFYVGHTSAAGGGFAAGLLIANPDVHNAIVLAYLAQRYGLGA